MSEYSAPTQFIDLVAQQSRIRSNIETAIKRVLDHGQYIMGPEVKELEAKLQSFTGAEHAITCANGTDALSLVLMAWNIGPGDAVFVPSFTYVATAEAPVILGATPFFVDVCKDTFTIDPQSFKQAIIDCKGIGLNPAAVIPVDLFGQPCDFEAINEVAYSENIKVLIDGAQSFGASLNGVHVGAMGHATTTSFFPAKPLGCYGDGGSVFTDSDEDALLIRSISLHGKGSHKYENVNIGVNSRLDTIQAAILLEKLQIFSNELIEKERVSKEYNVFLGDSVKTPSIRDGARSAWAQYTICLKNRDLAMETLKSHNIPCVIYYPIPLSEQKAYSQFPKVSSGLEVSRMLSNCVLSLPMHAYLKTEDVRRISSVLSQR